MTPEQGKFFESFYREHFQEIAIYAYCFLKNWDDANIAAQDAFHTCSNKIDEFMDKSNKVGWVKAIAKNKAYNILRARERMTRRITSFSDLPIEPFSFDHYDIMPSALDECARILSPEELTLFKHITIDGESYIDAAKAHNITVWACRKRMQRIKEKLKSNWHSEDS